VSGDSVLMAIGAMALAGAAAAAGLAIRRRRG
jgi:MYXO-CTERM domain-containing protein